MRVLLLLITVSCSPCYASESSEMADGSLRKLRKEIKQYILSDRQNNVSPELSAKIARDHDFNAEIVSLWQRYHSAYPPIMLQIDLNEFCNRWQLGHIQLFSEKNL